MRTIPHRELRNESAKVLEEVRSGGIVQVTNHGQVVAVMIPPGASHLDTLRRAGLVRPSKRDLRFSDIPRVTRKVRSSDVIDDLRSE
jgi:prevent-host-death family protein